ncbi:MAG: potassium transporter Kup [Alphaproteobacteria bacterium]|nr:potassium transporter Kup [Alphaproteobacteria bacterium]
MTTATADAATPAASIKLAGFLGVLGVVYGDIGTSPLYALKASLEHFKEGGMVRADVLGVLSLILWSLILVVTVKYVLLVMRADNRGEGGILALMTLAQRGTTGPRLTKALTMIGICGAGLFFGDGMITPAISVLSAVEGLEIAAPAFKEFVLPLSVVIILALFLVQSHGTAAIGRLFGPIMVLWFGAIGLLGLRAIAGNPEVLLAISPTYAVAVLLHHGFLAFLVLGSVVLAVTGAEALYADMGHFGRRPIQLAWLVLVLPCLLLNYFGQGALVLSDPATLSNPFFLLCPEWLRLPMVILATAATVIASQALISGAYSMARQCMQMGFLPRLTVRHTSATEEGQIYLPQVNMTLLLGVLFLVAAFRSSDSLASAYGIAVTGTFIATSILAIVAFRRTYHWSRMAALGVFGGLMVIDIAFFASNALKIFEGGWVPLVLGMSIFVLMTTWKSGRGLLLERWKTDSLPLASFLARLPQSRTIRVPGLAVFMTGNPDYVPGALLHNLKHNKVLHEQVLFVTVQTVDVPEVRPAERAEITALAAGIHRVLIRYGFMESPNLPRELAGLEATGVMVDSMQASYFLGRETLVAATAPKMSMWRMWLFLLMARNSVSATEFFRIPSDRVVELGVRVAI